MIYLIGGTTRCGKTILAKKMSGKLQIPWISVDSLRPVIQPYVSSPEQLPLDQMWENQDNDKLMTKYSIDHLIDVGRIEAKTLWPGVRAFIKHNEIISQDYIIEGEQLLPELVSELKNTIKIAYLIRQDEKKTLEGIQQKHDEHDWLLLSSKKKETLEKAARLIVTAGGRLKKEADTYGYPTVVVDDNFFEQLDLAAKILTN